MLTHCGLEYDATKKKTLIKVPYYHLSTYRNMISDKLLHLYAIYLNLCTCARKTLSLVPLNLSYMHVRHCTTILSIRTKYIFDASWLLHRVISSTLHLPCSGHHGAGLRSLSRPWCSSISPDCQSLFSYHGFQTSVRARECVCVQVECACTHMCVIPAKFVHVAISHTVIIHDTVETVPAIPGTRVGCDWYESFTRLKKKSDKCSFLWELQTCTGCIIWISSFFLHFLQGRVNSWTCGWTHAADEMQALRWDVQEEATVFIQTARFQPIRAHICFKPLPNVRWREGGGRHFQTMDNSSP